MDKNTAVRQLAEVRRAARWSGYAGIGDFHGGVYECDFVSPYTKSAGNIDAEVMVILQDWASTDALNGPVEPDRVALGRDPSRPTNTQLQALLNHHFGLQLGDVYATNLFPFVKQGAMDAKIPDRDLVRAAREFALPQIEIVRPVIAVCLGIATFKALAVAAGYPPPRSVADGVERPFEFAGTRVWCQAHTGQQGTNIRNRGDVGRVDADWSAMAEDFRERRLQHPL